MQEVITTDMLCVGAGLAGERVAIETAEAGFRTICLSLVPARRSHSAAAQGGMQAALGNCAMGEGDSPDVHFADTVKGSDWGCDQEVAKLFCETAPVAIRQLAHWGVPWNRVEPGEGSYFQGGQKYTKIEKPEHAGLITARNFGGTAKWRTCYTSDGTGHTVLFTMDNKAAQVGIEVHDRCEAVALLHDGTRCFGVVARCMRTGRLRIYYAKAVLIASGGFGRIYRESTNAVICTGGGQAICLDTGVVPLGNMEAIQFHPTGVVPGNILVTEGCRGDGGVLLDVDKKRFMHIYEPAKAELASRDVVSRRMTEHIRAGKGVPSPYGEHLWLDIRHLGAGHITTRLREVEEICTNFLGVDPINQLIPVRPTQHYSMGGVRTDKHGQAYGLKGLFAAGEAACWDMHGFNRLGGNSLAETVVAGMIVGRSCVRFLKGESACFDTGIAEEQCRNEQRRIQALIGGGGRENAFALRNEMQDVMMEGVGIFRNEKGLADACARLQELHARSAGLKLASDGSGANAELSLALQLPGMIRLALCVARGALERTESRGSHAREDYPARNDRDWLVRTLSRWDADSGQPRLDYESASRFWEIPPGDRGYGGGTVISENPKTQKEATE
jgi:fumarate reductase flavoprotein subunit